jgi:hypothetical protein
MRWKVHQTEREDGFFRQTVSDPEHDELGTWTIEVARDVDLGNRYGLCPVRVYPGNDGDQWWASELTELVFLLIQEAREAWGVGPDGGPGSVFGDGVVTEFQSAWAVVEGHVEWQEGVSYPRDDRGREYQEFEGLVQAMGVNDAGFCFAWVRERDLGVFRVSVREVQATRLQLGNRARFRVYQEVEGLLLSFWEGP